MKPSLPRSSPFPCLHFPSPLSVVLCVVLLLISFDGNAQPSKVKLGSSHHLGTNLGEVNDYSPQFPFTNLFRASRPWLTQCEVNVDPGCAGAQSFDTGESELLDLDSDGWVRSLPTRAAAPIFTSVATVWDFPTSFPGGRYVVRYEGEGTIEYRLGAIKDDGASKPGRDLIVLDPTKGAAVLRITATDPARNGNYLRAIRVIAERDEQRADSKLFSSRFIEQLEPYQVLRFMDWMRTNNSVVSRYNERAKPTDARYATEQGVPAEVMIDLANTIKKSPWFNMPHRADDAYVRSFAEVAKQRLDANLSVYVEYSNEVWNPAFAQGDWVEEQGSVVFSQSKESGFTNRINFYGRRSAEVCDIWKEVFGDDASRVVCVMGAQAANGWTASEALQCPLWNRAPCVAHGISVLAIAPYFGDYLGQEANAQEVLGWTNEPDGGFAKLFSELSTGGVLSGGPLGGALAESIRWIRDTREITQQHGIELVTYEGGQHLVGVGSAQDNDALTNLFVGANRDPRIGTLYQRYLAAWKKEAGGLFMHFSDIGSYSRFGSWGALERVGQISSPKYDALRGSVGLAPRPLGTARLTVRKTGPGSVMNRVVPIRCGSKCTGRIVRGKRIYLRAMPARGARFVTWSGACRHNRSVCSVVMNSNKVVRATFTKNLFISET